MTGTSIETCLTDLLSSSSSASEASFLRQAELKASLLGLCRAANQIASLAAHNGLSTEQLGALSGAQNEDGDDQKQLDVLADQIVAEVLLKAGIHSYFSEERTDIVGLNAAGTLGVACDPLDGSSNIDTNLTIGTIFSIFDMTDCQTDEAGKAYLPPIGRKQIASGMFVYGPQTSLLLAYDQKIYAFAKGQDGGFYHLDWDVSIPQDSSEFAINASNVAFWPAGIQAYFHDLSQGARAAKSGMRWAGSLVADCYRICRRGGVFLYPQDRRDGYQSGRLRLVYEANPIALLIEAAGGMASTGQNPILDEAVTDLHQRVPLLFGSAAEMKHLLSIISSHKDPAL